MSDPGVTVVIRGGTGPTAVDTETVTAKARVVLGAADAIDAVADGLRLARVSVEAVVPRTFGARPFDASSAPPPLDTASGWGTPAVAFWSADVARAKAAVLDELDAAVAGAQERGRTVRGVGQRMLQAVAVYDDAELAATSRAEDLVLRVAGTLALPGAGPFGPAASALGLLVAGGTAGVVDSVLDGRFSWGTFVTGTGGMHPATIRALSRAIGIFDTGRAWNAAPTVGNGASVLRGLVQPLRDRFLPDPDVHRVDGSVYDLPRPTDVDSALRAVAALGSDDSVLSVQKIVKEDGAPAWVVAIPGTQPGNLRSVFTMTSNYDLMDDDPGRRAQADSVRAVLDAMEQSGIAQGDDVVLVGHSQGGMIAATVAAATVGRYDVRHVVTAGSPVAGHDLPPGVRGTHLETQGEGVSDLDGAENPATADRVTVTGTLPASDGGPGLEIPHSIGYHRQVLAAASVVGDRGLEEHLADVEALLTGVAEEPMVYEARLVPDPETTFCVGDVTLPRPAWPPTWPSWPTGPGAAAPGGVVLAPGGGPGAAEGTFGDGGDGGDGAR